MKKTFIVAELSSNHGNKKSIIRDTIKAAKDSGADGFKIQTFDLDHMTLNIRNDTYKNKSGLWKGYFHYDLYKEIQLPWGWHEMIFEECYKVGLICFSTPFDINSVLFLEELNNPIYKIASSEISHIPLLEYVSKLGKPIIFSTGVATEEDIETAIKTIRPNTNDITILKCTSSYPTPLEDSNILSLRTLKEKYGFNVGLSDHTLGHAAALGAVANGAILIEKHFILNKSIVSADSSFSMTPESFLLMSNEIRNIEKILGSEEIEQNDFLKKSRLHMRSIFSINKIKKGEIFSEQNIRVMRPNFGLPPSYFNGILGKKAKKTIEKNTPIQKEDI